MRRVVLSLNSTDRDCENASRIVEIGCVELDDMLPSGRVFHSYFNPQQSVNSTYLYSHGITDEFLSGYPYFSNYSQGFFDFISDTKIVTHNADIIMRCLNHEIERCGLPRFQHDRIIDTLSIAREFFPFLGESIDELRETLDVHRDLENRESALNTAEILSEIFQKLRRRNSDSGRLSAQIAVVLRNSNISRISALETANLLDSVTDSFLNASRLNALPDEVVVFKQLSAVFRRLSLKDNYPTEISKYDVESLREEVIKLRKIIDTFVETAISGRKSSVSDGFLSNFYGSLGKSSALIVLGTVGYFLSTYAPKSLDGFAEVLLKFCGDTGS